MKTPNVTDQKFTKWYGKNYLVDYKLQLKIVLILAAITFIFTSLMRFISYSWILHLRPVFDWTIAGPLKPDEGFTLIANILLYRMVLVMTLMYVFFVFVGIILTHRLTGPIWKLQRELKRFLNEEKIETIDFRSTDEFRELPELINKLIKGYKAPESNS